MAPYCTIIGPVLPLKPPPIHLEDLSEKVEGQAGTKLFYARWTALGATLCVQAPLKRRAAHKV